MISEEYIKGRGAQIQSANPYQRLNLVQEHWEGLDEPLIQEVKTQVFYEQPRKIVNKVDSPDVGMEFSANPYQGCEHGCIYCYARNTHQYWGYSAGIDFESKIIVKRNAAALLRETFDKSSWKPAVISLSGNTDCYQPLERKYEITRQMLQVCLEYKNPVGVITKNALVLRDLDILKELASLHLVQVFVSIGSWREDLRLKLEPRTSSYQKRFKVLETLSAAGIACGVMVAPIIPGLNVYDVPEVIRMAAEAGAYTAGYTMLRLNGAVAELFQDWLQKNYPEAAHKVWSQVQDIHGGQVNDSRYGKRMRGEGNLAESIQQLFRLSRNKYMSRRAPYIYNMQAFQRPAKGQLPLF